MQEILQRNKALNYDADINIADLNNFYIISNMEHPSAQKVSQEWKIPFRTTCC